MGKRRLTLVQKRKHQKLHKLILLFCLLLLLGVGIYLLMIHFSIRQVKVKGNTSYTDQEIITEIKKGYYVDNTIAMTLLQAVTHETYLPFIEDMTMSIESPHVLRIKVKESIRAGVFEYMDRNVYFDSEGIAQESRNTRLDGVPLVTGVKFDQMVLGEQIPVEGDYFDTIIDITKKINSYQLDISEIHFEQENEIYLISGNYQIYLGNNSYLTNKMSRIKEILKSVSAKCDSGTVDMHLLTDEKEIITFRKD